MKGFSVVICCYNGSARIRETLIHLFGLNVASGFQFEILLINNNSTDDTVDVAKRANEEFNLNQLEFRIVHENIPGLSAARRRGILESKYEFVLFCDDDNYLENNYLVEAYRIISEKPEIGIIGGWCKPKLPFYPGKWIESNYAALAIESSPREAGYVDWVFGAGMIVKKSLYLVLEQRSIKLFLTGRLGSKQTSGDDAELCLLAGFVGFKIYYTPELQLFHAIAPHRLSKRSFIKANYRNVYQLVYLYLVDNLMKNHGESENKLFRNYLLERIHMIFHFLPRVAFGKYRFYSFLMLFQNIQLFYWLLTRRKIFMKTTRDIRTNLYHGTSKN